MPSWIVIGVCAAVFVFIVVAVGAFGGFDSPMSRDAGSDRDPKALGDDIGPETTAADISALRFTSTLRGYRPAEVDAVLAKLGERIDAQNAVIASLRGEAPNPSAVSDRDAAAEAPDPDTADETTAADATPTDAHGDRSTFGGDEPASAADEKRADA